MALQQSTASTDLRTLNPLDSTTSQAQKKGDPTQTTTALSGGKKNFIKETVFWICRFGEWSSHKNTARTCFNCCLEFGRGWIARQRSAWTYDRRRHSTSRWCWKLHRRCKFLGSRYLLFLCLAVGHEWGGRRHSPSYKTDKCIYYLVLSNSASSSKQTCQILRSCKLHFIPPERHLDNSADRHDSHSHNCWNSGDRFPTLTHFLYLGSSQAQHR